MEISQWEVQDFLQIDFSDKHGVRLCSYYDYANEVKFWPNMV